MNAIRAPRRRSTLEPATDYGPDHRADVVREERQKNSCDTPHDYAKGEIEVAAVAHGSGHMPCGRHAGEQQITSKFGHGGARLNAGGLRQPAGGRPRKSPIRLVEPVRREGPLWFVVETYGQAERLAASELARRGYTTYLPLRAVRRQDAQIRSVWHKVLVPQFSGYLFVEFDRATTEWVPILHQPGVRGIIRDAAQRPMPVPVGFVETLRESDAERCELPSETLPRHAPGLAVIMPDGPFCGFPGVVLTCDGVTTRVNVAIFGRMVPIEMARADVRPT